MENILKESNIVEQILRRLNEIAPIPTEGFLAGGAVANTLLGMKYGDIEYPINDLDIYIEEDPDGPTRSSSAPLRSDSLIVEDGYYGGTIGYQRDTTYRITGVRYEGFYNIIDISAIDNRNRASNPTYILKGFDLNCCQVGIDLSTNTLYYTTEFEEFLETKQLDVTSVYTPAHTAIRLFKKKKELNCYCNVEACMELLSQPLLSDNIIHLDRAQFGFYFTDKYKDMYIRYYGELKHYFRMIKFFDHKRRVWDARYQYRTKQNNKKLDKDHAVNWLDPHRTPPQGVLERWANLNDRLWTLTPTKYSERNLSMSDILKGTVPNPLTFMSAYNLIRGKMKKTQINKAKLIIENGSYTKLLALVNPNFYNCDFTLEHVNNIDEVIRKNPIITRFIGKYEMNLQQTLTFVNDIERIIKKEGFFILNILTQALEESNSSILPTHKNMMKWVEAKKKEMDKPLIQPQDISGLELPDNVEIKEIISECQLQWSGQKLKNCLNNEGQGYADKIKEGKVKVFIIKTINSTSAFEIFVEKNGLSYGIQQLLSTCNKKPSLYHTVISQLLITHLNTNLLKRAYQSRLKNYEDMMVLNNALLATTQDLSTKNNEITYGLDAVPVDNELGYIFDREGMDIGNDFIEHVIDDEITEVPPEIEETRLRNIYGRQGNIIGEELVVERPETIGDLIALRELATRLNELEPPRPLGHYLTNEDTENLEIEDELDPMDPDRFGD